MDLFSQQRNLVTPYLREISGCFAAHSLDEQAIPSYLSDSFLLRETFWYRLRLAARGLQSGPYESILDYGCGLGAFLPYLSQHAERVYAYDHASHTYEPASKLVSKLELANVSLLSSMDEVEGMPEQSLDRIVALDVLEHVDELKPLLFLFAKLLKPEGELIVCSPTEYWFYRLARKFAPAGYQGEYHLRAADDVEADLRTIFSVRVIGRAYPGVCFFRVVTCRKQSR